MKLKDVFNNLGADGNGDYVERNLRATVGKRNITKFKTSVKLDVEIVAQSTKHSEERQEGRGIPDPDIRATIFKATEKIMQYIIDGRLKEGVKFHIYDPGNDHLNIIATFHLNEKGTPEKIKVITAMRNKNFHANDVQRTIKV